MPWNHGRVSPTSPVRDVIRDLFNTEYISGSQKQRLSSHDLDQGILCSDPALEMDLRHDKAKKMIENSTNSSRKKFPRNELRSEAMRIVTQEELREKAAKNRDRNLERELKRFQTNLSQSSQRFEPYDTSNTNRGRSIERRTRRRDVRAKSSGHPQPVARLAEQGRIHGYQQEDGQLPEVPNYDHAATKGRRDSAVCIVKKRDAIEEISMVQHCSLPNEIIQPQFETKETQTINVIESKRLVEQIKQTTVVAINNKVVIGNFEGNSRFHDQVLKSHWFAWYKFVKERERLAIYQQKENARYVKIHGFLSEMSAKAAKAAYLQKQQAKLEKKFQNCPYLPTMKSNIKTPIKTNPFLLLESNNTFVEKQKTLEKMVEQQKNKLAEQQKMINDLKLEQIKLATEKSSRKTQVHLEKSFVEGSGLMQRKLYHLRASSFSGLTTGAGRRERAGLAAEMEARHQERQRRKVELKEKMRQRTLDQQRIKVEREREYKLQLVEQKRMEHELKVQQIEEQAYLRSLEHAASAFLRRRLLRFGLGLFRSLLAVREARCLAAQARVSGRMLRRAFVRWKEISDLAQMREMERARKLRRRKLLLKIWTVWKQEGLSSLQDKQVADDYHELMTQEKTFKRWRAYTLQRCVATDQEIKRATAVYNMTLLRRCLAAWRRLHETLDLERVSERKKEALRKSVRMVLPDFGPRHGVSALSSSVFVSKEARLLGGKS